MSQCPKYLEPYAAIWEKDPRQANLEWFKDAKYGLFLHYGLYSLLHQNEWAMRNNKIPLAEYEKLAEQFTAHNFDADAITDMAIAAGMKYVNMTTCHHESFCLWDSKVEPYNSMNYAGRDLVKEMSEACARKGLGFFTYYTFMLNWRHPYFVDRSVMEVARPAYDFEEPRYLYRKKEDFAKYIDYIEEVMDELLSKYQITGIWLDLISSWYVMGEEYIPIERIYERLRKKHPGVLISWKSGATGTEDFASPEYSFSNQVEKIRSQHGDAAAERARIGFEGNQNKHNEVCATVQSGSWSYSPMHPNHTVDELYELLRHAGSHDCNLLLNVGPMADGSIHPKHKQILLELGERIKREGFPK